MPVVLPTVKEAVPDWIALGAEPCWADAFGSREDRGTILATGLPMGPCDGGLLEAVSPGLLDFCLPFCCLSVPLSVSMSV